MTGPCVSGMGGRQERRGEVYSNTQVTANVAVDAC